MSELAPRTLIVGGGITGLVAAYELLHARSDGDRESAVILVDASRRLGGKIESERAGGFVVEAGPDSFITRKPAALELARELGLEAQLRGTHPRHRKVYVVHRGQLVPLPEGMTLLVPRRLGPVFRSPLLSWRGKLRLALERVIPPRRNEGDESLADFVRRRFGDEVLERVAGPLLAGIHSSDPARLSLQATFPRFAELERQHGSLLRAVRRARGSRLPSPTSARMTLAAGMDALVGSLVARLEAASPESLEIRTGRRVVRLAPRRPETERGSGWSATLDDGTTLEVDAIVLAVPAAAASALLEPVDRQLAAALRELPTAPAAMVTLGWPRGDVPHPLDGYGFLVPAAEGRRITACTWSSTKFDHRAPPDHALLRSFVGGARHGCLVELDDEALIALTLDELRELVGITAPPVLARVHRVSGGNPRYEVGHRERVAALEAACPAGLFLAGAAYHGVGLPDCIESGRRAAKAAAVHRSHRKSTPVAVAP